MFDEICNKVFVSRGFQFLLSYGGFLLLGLGFVMLAYGICP